MCGISGIFGYRQTLSLDDASLLARAERIAHRGPDDAGAFIDGSLGFGFRRLAIIDLHTGHQPMVDERTGCAIEFNGEIYNYLELRTELQTRGHVFHTSSDTEAILHGYIEWGDEVVDRLNGIFGFAIWDPRRQRLVLARDHYGVKPLYYADHSGVLRFGSEMRTILDDPDVPRELDQGAVRLLLHYGYLPSPHTLLKGIHKLGPGEMLACDEHGVKVWRHAGVTEEINHSISDAEATDQYVDLFEAAVERQLLADVEVGCLLSGGVDSGMVLSAATARSDEPIPTFTVSFGDDFEHDESADAAETAKHFGARHHDLRIDVDDVEQLLLECLWHLEEPVLSQSTFAYHLMTKEVRKQVKVVLTGQGADEPWGGYDRYLGERYGTKAGFLFRSTLAESISSKRPGAERFRRATESLGLADPVDRFTAIHQVFDPKTVEALGGSEILDAGEQPRDVMARAQAPVAHLDTFSQLLHIDTRLSLPDDLLLYGDKLSMSNSVEARVPMLDRELMAFIESLPPEMKLRRGRGKYLHKEAALRFLPESFVHRKKRGFATPIDKWFANELGPLIERTVLSPDSICCQVFDRNALTQLLADHRDGVRNYRRQLTTLVSLEIVAAQLLSPGNPRPIGAERLIHHDGVRITDPSTGEAKI